MDADAVILGIVRGAGTVVLFLTFVAYAIWVYLPGQQRRFEEASMLPFREEDERLAVRPETNQ